MPLSGIGSSVWPHFFAFAFWHTVHEVALIDTTVGIGEFAFASLRGAIGEVGLNHVAVWEVYHTWTYHLSVLPRAFQSSPVGIDVYSLAVVLSLHPLAFVFVAVGEVHCSEAVRSGELVKSAMVHIAALVNYRAGYLSNGEMAGCQ